MDMKLPRSIASVSEVYGGMTGLQTQEFLRLCAQKGYQSDINKLASLSVDTWYEQATDGERNHMANKLIKHGYPVVGINSKAHIESEALAEALAEGYQKGYEEGIDGYTLADKLGVHSLPYILKTLREHKYTLADIVVAWTAP